MAVHRIILLCFAAALLTTIPALAVTATLLPGIYTNDEQVDFAREAGTPVPPWTGLRIEADGAGFAAQRVDVFGTALGQPQRWQVTEAGDRVSIRAGVCTRDFAVVPAGLTIINQSRTCAITGGPTTFTAKGMAMVAADGTLLEMQRGRAFKCEAVVPRKDGKADWWVKGGLMVHDAGGRLAVVSDEAVPQRFTLRLRNTVSRIAPDASGLALSVHTDNPDEAIATALADPAAIRIGLVLATIQARCALVTSP